MPLKAFLDSLDGLSDAEKALYKPVAEGDHAGKFILDVEPVAGLSLENVDGLKNALTTTKSELSEAKEALKSFDGLKLKPSVIKDKLTKLERLEKIDPETEAGRLAEEKINARLEEVNRGHSREVEKRDRRERTLMSQVEKLLIDNQAAAAIAKHKGTPELLIPVLRPRLKVEEEDGQFSVKVLDEKGGQEFAIRDSKAVPATIEDLVAKFKADPIYGRAFEGSGQSGTGSDPNRSGGNNPTGAKNPWLKESWSVTEQMRLLGTNPQLAAAFQAQANA
jgi:hypothetical protein